MLRKHTRIKPPVTLSQIEWEAFNEENTIEMHRQLHPMPPRLAAWRDEQMSEPTRQMPAVRRSWNSVRHDRVRVKRSLAEKLSLTWLLVFDREAALAIMRMEELAAERQAQAQRSSKSHFLR